MLAQLRLVSDSLANGGVVEWVWDLDVIFPNKSTPAHGGACRLTSVATFGPDGTIRSYTESSLRVLGFPRW